MGMLNRPHITIIAALLLALAAAWAAPVCAQNAATPDEGYTKDLRLSWETGEGKSRLVPALEIPAFILLLNGFDRAVFSDEVKDGRKVYNTSLSTFYDQLTDGHWANDDDSFEVNQFGHPYQGSVYHGFARSAGLSYWESLLYTNAGSFLWETAGETTHPSVNDQVASGVGGSFIGEALFRMASLVLERGEGRPGVFRELCAAVVSPPTGFNRHAFGERFGDLFPSHDPITSWQFQIGASWNARLEEPLSHSPFQRCEAVAVFAMSYGLPGKEGYSFSRPFDYFHFEYAALGNKDNPIDNVMIHGLLLGKDFNLGRNVRGIWGLFGGYDYISPHVFRVSSTSVSFGTTCRIRLSEKNELQGTLLGGAGFIAAGNIGKVGDRDYDYGLAPQGLLRLRLVLGERVQLDLTGRSFYLNGIVKRGIEGGRDVNRHHLDAGVTVRLKGSHGVSVQYTVSTRDVRLPEGPEIDKRRRTVKILYTFLGSRNFGAVDWRDQER